MVGHLIMGISLVLVGRPAEGRVQLDRAVKLYDPSEHRSLATRFGHDVRASALVWRAFALWALGYPEAARADTVRALEDSREIGHAATSMFALSHSALTLIHRGDHAGGSARADELVALADGKGTLYWKAYGMLLHGWLSALTGKSSEAVSVTTSAITAMRSTGRQLMRLGICHIWRAAMRSLGNSTMPGAACRSNDGGGSNRGKMVRRRCPSHCRRNRIDVAGAGRGKSAAVFRTCARGGAPAAGEILGAARGDEHGSDVARAGQATTGPRPSAPVYRWFTEGLDTLDLKQARMVLDELAL